MRFLMLNWRDPKNPQSGGAERVSQAYLSALARRGHEVYWFANAFEGGNQSENIDGMEIIRGGGKGTSVWKAFRWYRGQKPFDLVIDQHHGIPWFAPWWSRTNSIAYIHEVLGPIWQAFYGWPVSRLGQWQERWTHWLYRNVTFWVPSESTKRALLLHGVREVKVFTNGTDTKPLAELERKPLASPLRLVAVSRLAPNKRVEHAIQAVKLLLQKELPVHLTIVGTGEAENELRHSVRQLELDQNVSFAGQLPEGEKNAQLRLAHFLVHTSLREGWGLNVIEANAMGTPAVVYPVGGLIDSTLHNQTGIVADKETPEALARGIIQVAREPDNYVKLRVNAWERSKTLQWQEVLSPVCDWLEVEAAKSRDRKKRSLALVP